MRTALGAPDLPIEIENVQRWSATADWAGALLGRAASSSPATPPTSCRRPAGSAATRGVQDAYDLAWKLAPCSTAPPGRALLDTYDAERRPVGAFTAEQAYTRYVLRLDPELGKENLVPIVDEAAVELGYRHLSDAVTLEPGDDGASWEDPRAPTGRPGMRAPHLAVERGGATVSLLDLYGGGFVVLGGERLERGGRARGRAAAACRRGVPPGRGLPDASSSVRRRCTASATRARRSSGPDGFVAWRTRRGPQDDEDALARALAAAIGR